MAEGACIHGLAKVTCADCTPPVRPLYVRPRRPGNHLKTFLARYDGVCRHCGDEFEAGDPIGYIDDEIACFNCVREG